MPATYEKIATTTLGSATATITFSTIPATYTDIRVVLSSIGVTTAGGDLYLRFNGDTATNYSRTRIYGDGATATSNRGTSIDNIPLSLGITVNPCLYTADIFSYAGSTYKTVLTTLSEDNNGSGYTGNVVGLWRNTAAITSLVLSMSSSTFKVGTTATLYGILKA
jgi:hypothetical protein